MADLHERNPHSGLYDFDALVKSLPELEQAVVSNPTGEKTIDFSDARSVFLLNKALVRYYYKVENWQIPEGYLCPAVPGRADHIHYAADLLGEYTGGDIPRGRKVHVLDTGTGAGCIYPVIGCGAFGWKFTASEIDPLSLKMSRLIVQTNPSISKLVKVKQQKQKQFIFRNIIEERDFFDLTVCNPPFFASQKEAVEANREKWRKMTGEESPGNLNFGGMENELWYPGGEAAFIGKMIRESAEFADQVNWFTSLVSRKENLAILEKQLSREKTAAFKTISMSQGNKNSRLLAWTFMSESRRQSLADKYKKA
ncbi:23S rRNA (adenine(1618)-N(6))-methyltransferase RlmF [Spirochaeta isovalerica]|uniref:23S rRNA (Adenine1618-N6)-methyltransferase n=1 Tax=Spirochaeta isovalerica TaxID=150 RepID=A0A841RBV2_9SPIO|nr:23S rRNA (adenine(1618)-N(6))-methyltransferase RlmF [Spirochaeta isovalerica]MBB6480490.1 23S rRNA (adenine1618-N6)-methyltransferase [Spirochaeta isovalerica]